jgi:broad specificity phosphatase PhoE
VSETTIYLLRHGDHGLLGRRLCGRGPGVEISDRGRAQAAALCRRLAQASLAAVYCSPLRRTVQTAEPLAQACGAPLRRDEDLLEVDFGEWTGASFDELAGQELWSRWNQDRGRCRPPGGESMAEVQARFARWLERARSETPQGAVAAVSHCDVIKAAIAHVLGWSLQFHDRLEISPGSISTLVVGDWGAKVHSINEAAA